MGNVYIYTVGTSALWKARYSLVTWTYSNYVGIYIYCRYLGSMEGAVLAGKLAAEIVVDDALGEVQP